jgi:hypothetical protein
LPLRRGWCLIKDASEERSIQQVFTAGVNTCRQA